MIFFGLFYGHLLLFPMICACLGKNPFFFLFTFIQKYNSEEKIEDEKEGTVLCGMK